MQRDPEVDYENAGSTSRGLSAMWGRIARSGALTAVALAVLLGGVTAIYMAHMRGRIHQLTNTKERDSVVVQTARPGGQDVVHLTRPERIGAVSPEFSSATLLPGDGMLLLQTTLAMPGRGDVPLLQSTPEADLTAASLGIAGATFSVLAQSHAGSVGGTPVELVAGSPASQVSNDIVPDGSRADAHFAADGKSTAAQQGVDVTVETSVTGRGLEVTVSAHNGSGSPRWLTIGWQPRFLAPSAGLSALAVLPPTAGSDTVASEIPLGRRNVDEMYSNLKHSYLSTGPEVRLLNRADGYTLRMTALTPSIHSLHVQAAKDGKSVLLAFSTAGKEGAEAPTVVAPGETLEWRVRVEALPESTTAYASSAQ